MGVLSGIKVLVFFFGLGFGRDFLKTRFLRYFYFLKVVEVEEEKKNDIDKCRKVVESLEIAGK